eukprot:2585661-Amphidinium_carterae.1
MGSRLSVSSQKQTSDVSATRTKDMTQSRRLRSLIPFLPNSRAPRAAMNKQFGEYILVPQF